MKKILLFALLPSLILYACNNKKTERAVSSEPSISASTEKNTTAQTSSDNGIYTEAGKTYNGPVEIISSQANKSFNVVCKGDMINEISFFFSSEAAARKGGTFKKGSMVPIYDDEIGITYGIGYRSKGSPDGTVTVTRNGSSNVIEFTDMVLTADGKNVTVSGKIPF